MFTQREGSNCRVLLACNHLDLRCGTGIKKQAQKERGRLVLRNISRVLFACFLLACCLTGTADRSS